MKRTSEHCTGWVLCALAAVALVAGCGNGDRPDLRQEWEREVEQGERTERPTRATPPPRPDEIPATAEEPAAREAPAFEGTAGIIRQEARTTGVPVQRELRAARNPGFDRVVFEFEDELPGYHVEYIDRPVRECGSGNVVDIDGDGWLRIRFEPARAHEIHGERATSTMGDRARELGLPVIAAAHLTCDFEAVLEWVLGVESPNRYRVLELREPARLVVDILQD